MRLLYKNHKIKKMDKNQILAQLTQVMEKLFDVKNLKVSETTIASDIEEWDSLNHIQLVVAIEKSFKIKFAASEIQNWKNVGEIMQSIESKLPKA